MKKFTGLSILVALFIMGGAMHAGAEEEYRKTYTLDTIFVTAEKRVENLQDVPVSIGTISEQEVKDAGIRSIKDVSMRIPNLFIANWGARANSFAFIRGIGAVSNSPAMGFYVDDVNYMDSRVFDINLFDIERIEVLRGPQGTLYGRNSIAGVINIVTKKPDNNLHYGLEQVIGSENLFETSLYMRVPLIEDKLFIGVSGVAKTRDGYTHNDLLNEDVDNLENFNGRMQVRWLPTSKLDITASVDAETMDDGVYPLTDLVSIENNPYHLSHDYEGRDKRDVFGSSLRVAYEAPGFDLTSITAYRNYDDLAENDQDFSQLDAATSHEAVKGRQLSQEFRFASPENSGPFKWLGGLYAYSQDKDQILDMRYGADVAQLDPRLVPGMIATQMSDTTSSGYAVFGQGTYTLFDKLDLTLGLRYGYDKNEIDHSAYMTFGGGLIPGTSLNLDGDQDESAFLPKAQIAYHWTPSLMTYAGISRGYRSGGFNTNFADTSDLSYDAEYSTNYEVGFKSSWLDDRLTANVALFYIDLTDQQVTQVLPTQNSVIRNAGKSKSMGFEVETTALLTDGLIFEAGFGYTDMTYSEYFDAITGVDYKGNKGVLAPEYTYNLALQYNLPLLDSFELFGKDDSLLWISRAELQGVGDFYWNDANTQEQDAYEFVNLRTGFETENYAVTFWVNNLFDKKYNVMYLPFLGGLAQLGAPLTFGTTLRIDF